jgi:hypothetical protein
VELLLATDGEYRRRAAAGELRKICPRRFNPTQEASLPIWHTERDGWAFTAMFTNANASWVSIFFERDGYEGQATAVTAARGLLAGLRVVRGREASCQAHHDALHRAAEPPHAPPLAAAAAARDEICL